MLEFKDLIVINRDIWKGHRSWLKRHPTGKIWDNLSIKKNNDSHVSQHAVIKKKSQKSIVVKM